MTITFKETIVAIATPPGRGGVGVVRVSGQCVERIAQSMLHGLPDPRVATYASFRGSDGQVLDQGIALYFPAPNSFTGEDVLELQGHGGHIIMDMLVNEILTLGARLARPGEFSERAFLNDKLDLIQAEAIADLIDSSSHEAARAAMRSLQGEFSSRVGIIKDSLIELRMWVESAIDFPEEEIDFLADSSLTQRLERLLSILRGLLATAQQGELLRDGLTIVIAGRPNAGKSSLLNSLVARESAIVTDVPGTTRDVLREQINIDGLPIHVVDTAGLRESSDKVERIGVDRAREEIHRADRVLLVVDDQETDDTQIQAIRAELPDDIPITLVRNKIDLSARAPGLKMGTDGSEIALSAASGEGMGGLRQHLKECAGFRAVGEDNFIARRRHLDALRRAEDLVVRGIEQLQDQRAGELLAEDLRHAQRALGEITGEFTADDLLGKIFASFCIGK